MEKEEIFEEIKKLVSERLDVGLIDIQLESSFVDDLGADSLDQVEIIMGVEEFFGIDIPDEDAEKIQTVQDAINYVFKALGSS